MTGMVAESREVAKEILCKQVRRGSLMHLSTNPKAFLQSSAALTAKSSALNMTSKMTSSRRKI